MTKQLPTDENPQPANSSAKTDEHKPKKRFTLKSADLTLFPGEGWHKLEGFADGRSVELRYETPLDADGIAIFGARIPYGESKEPVIANTIRGTPKGEYTLPNGIVIRFTNLEARRALVTVMYIPAP